jgi:flagellar motility protein MotE (MotC chaperone)
MMNPAVMPSPGTTVDRRYTPVEVELLQNLAQRRDELDRWERNIQIKESMLAATEKRIDQKITQIESMKKEVANLLSQYNEKEDTKIRSLVKIYENMKPKDAARIFDEVEMPILLLIVDKMSEKKVAPILSYMDSKKAKAITVQVAEQRRLSSKLLQPTNPANVTP